MEKTEIKKAFQKMSRQLKKSGINYTCVMNSRQMELGTATVCFGYIQDYETSIAKAKADLENREKIEVEVSKKVIDAARSIPLWREWASEGDEYWKERVAEWDAGTYADKCRQGIIDSITTRLRNHEEKFEKYGTVTEQYANVNARYKELLQAAPIVEFLNLVNGKTVLEFKSEGSAQYAYLRFYY